MKHVQSESISVLEIATLAALLGVFASSALAGPATGTVSGTIRDSLPKPSSPAPLAATYPRPGSVNITVARYCGDGDVANFAAHNSEVVFYNGDKDKTTPVVMGYWVAPALSAVGGYPVPNAVNWVPLGTANAALDGTPVPGLQPVNRASTTPQAAGMLLSSALTGLQAASGYAMPAAIATAGAPPKYQVYAAAMACKSLINAQTPGADFPMPFEVAGEFQDHLLQAVDGAIFSALGQSDPASALSPMTVALGASGPGWLMIALGDKGGHAIEDGFYEAAKRVLNLSFNPTNPAAAQDPGLSRALRQLDGDLQSATNCAQVHGVQTGAAGKRWWEPYDMQLTCAALNGVDWNQGSAVGSFHAAFATLYAATDPGTFSAARGAVAALLFRGAILQQAQNEVDAKYAVLQPRTTCVDYQHRYIDTVMSSLTLPIEFGAGKGGPVQVSLKATSPEGDFAGAGHMKYWTPPVGDFNTIFGMGGANAPLMLTVGAPVDPTVSTSLFQSVYKLQLTTRAIGCSTGVFFCALPRRGEDEL